MDRIFKELTPECEITARLYAQGYEKKEIARMKCRAVSTINNQLQKAFETLNVRNGRELARILFERITGICFTLDYSPVARSFVAGCLLVVFCISLFEDNRQDIRRVRQFRIEYRIRRAS